MNKSKLISIIIPCYNDFLYVEQSVNSALNQTYPNIELIVVDDGSNEETKTVLKRLEPKITKLIAQENQGQSKARNVGITAATGEYILTLDSDDFFEPTFCEKAITIFENEENAKIVTCNARLIFDKSRSYISKPRGGFITDFLFSNSALGTSLFKKEDWRICGGYDENMRQGFEDWEFFIRLLKNGGQAVVIDEPLYNYRRSDHSTTTRANVVKHNLQRYIYNKHRDLFTMHFELLIDHFLCRIENQEKERIKNLERIEFKIGNLLLYPIRRIKKLFK